MYLEEKSSIDVRFVRNTARSDEARITKPLHSLHRTSMPSGGGLAGVAFCVSFTISLATKSFCIFCTCKERYMKLFQAETMKLSFKQIQKQYY